MDSGIARTGIGSPQVRKQVGLHNILLYHDMVHTLSTLLAAGYVLSLTACGVQTSIRMLLYGIYTSPNPTLTPA